MAFLIVKALVFLQQAAQHDRARDKEQVRREDDHHDRDEEPHERRERLADADGEPVGRAEQYQTRRAEQPVRARGLFPRGLAAQQLHGVRGADADDVHE